jgi:hypothetical protein
MRATSGLAKDLGTASARIILGAWNGQRIELRDLDRFFPVLVRNQARLEQIRSGLPSVAAGIAVDAWALILRCAIPRDIYWAIGAAIAARAPTESPQLSLSISRSMNPSKKQGSSAGRSTPSKILSSKAFETHRSWLINGT